MDQALLARLRARGQTRALSDNGEGLAVTLQLRSVRLAATRAVRRQQFLTAFEDFARRVQNLHIEFDLDSVSVSAQTIEAVVALADFDALQDAAEHARIRVDILQDRDIT